VEEGEGMIAVRDGPGSKACMIDAKVTSIITRCYNAHFHVTPLSVPRAV